RAAASGVGVCRLGHVDLAVHADTLVRLGRSAEAATLLGAPGSDRFTAAARAAARFRLDPSPELAAGAERAAADARWPLLGALVGQWQGELLGDADAARWAAERFTAIGARRGADRAAATLRRLGG